MVIKLKKWIKKGRNRGEKVEEKKEKRRKKTGRDKTKRKVKKKEAYYIYIHKILIVIPTTLQCNAIHLTRKIQHNPYNANTHT